METQGEQKLGHAQSIGFNVLFKTNIPCVLSPLKKIKNMYYSQGKILKGLPESYIGRYKVMYIHAGEGELFENLTIINLYPLAILPSLLLCFNSQYRLDAKQSNIRSPEEEHPQDDEAIKREVCNMDKIFKLCRTTRQVGNPIAIISIIPWIYF